MHAYKMCNLQMLCPCCRVPDWRQNLNKLVLLAVDDLHKHVGVTERFQRFREVSGVPAIEAATAELNRRLAARGASHLLFSLLLTMRRNSLRVAPCCAGL